MLAFLSYGMIQWKKSMMAHVYDLSTFFLEYTFNVIETMRACIVFLV
jgi:hypothetical protein